MVWAGPLALLVLLASTARLARWLGASEANMQMGHMRFEPNINLHIDTPSGKIATPIVEVKNMNSFRAVERALAFEADRQLEAWRETGHRLQQRRTQPGLLRGCRRAV